MYEAQACSTLLWTYLTFLQYLKCVLYEVNTTDYVQRCTHDIKNQREDAWRRHWFQSNILTCKQRKVPINTVKITKQHGIINAMLYKSVLPDAGPCSMCPLAVPLVRSTSSRLISCGGWMIRSPWTSANVTSSAGPPLWLYCCFSF